MINNNKINQWPRPYQKIWLKCRPLLQAGRPGDLNHAREIAQFILDYQGSLTIDKDILIPVALMHDIGHSAILAEHFKLITGPHKIINGKLVHMLAGAKIAKDILTQVHYPIKKTQEIVDIISSHDTDQLTGVNLKKAYNTKNKKIFHDIDSLDRYTETRIKGLLAFYPDRKKLLGVLAGLLDSFFYLEFKKIARTNLRELLK